MTGAGAELLRAIADEWDTAPQLIPDEFGWIPEYAADTPEVRHVFRQCAATIRAILKEAEIGNSEDGNESPILK